MTKYESLTTPGVQHDAVNMITELILLNKNTETPTYPWRSVGVMDFWKKTVAALRKLVKVHGLDPEQLAFYVYRCQPTEINPAEFAKMAVVARKLFQKYDLESLVALYKTRLVSNKMEVLVPHKIQPEPKKSLLSFIKELENA